MPAWPPVCVAVVDDFLRTVARIDTLQALQSLMQDITHEIGFGYFALISHSDLRLFRPGQVDIKDYPAAVADRIIGQGQFKRDPIMRACLFSDAAFVWSEISQIIRMDRRDRDSIEFGLRHGLAEGITVPSFKLGQLLGSCTFAGTPCQSRARKMLGIAQIIGIFAFQRARRLSGEVVTPAYAARLNPRPRDCVVLAGRGFSNKEIARALALSPRTVDGYLAAARRLFDVDDRTELVTAALLAGEIALHELR